jgi:hypothetical protein
MLIVLLKQLFPDTYYGIYKMGVVDTCNVSTKELETVNKALEVL